MNQRSGKTDPRDSSDTKQNTFSKLDEESLSRHKRYTYHKLNDLYNLDSNNFTSSNSHSYRNNLLLSKENEPFSNKSKTTFTLFRDSKSGDSVTTPNSSSAGEEDSLETYPTYITPENYLILTDCKIICKNLKRYNRRNPNRIHIGTKKPIGTSHKRHDKMEVNVTEATGSDAAESESAVQLDFENSAESTTVPTNLDEFIQNPKPSEDANKNSLSYMLSKEHSDAIKRHWTSVGSPDEKVFGEIQNETTINVDAVKYTFGVQSVKGSEAVEIPDPFTEKRSSHAIRLDGNNEMIFATDLSNLSVEADSSAVSEDTLMESNRKQDFINDSQIRHFTEKGSGMLLEKSSEFLNEMNMNNKYEQFPKSELNAPDTTEMRCCKFEKCASHMTETDKNAVDTPCRRRRNFLFRFFGNICGKRED